MVGTWPELKFDKGGELNVDLEGHYQFAIIEPLVVHLHGQNLLLGAIEHTLLSAAIASIDGETVHAVPHLNDTVHDTFIAEVPNAPNGKQIVRGRAGPDATAAGPANDGRE